MLDQQNRKKVRELHKYLEPVVVETFFFFVECPSLYLPKALQFSVL
jgi:hypothetical protein